MRNISSDFRNEIQAQQSGEVFLTLLELSYEGADTIYLVNNYQNIVSNGITYYAFPFKFTLPEETETARKATIVIDNIDTTIGAFVLEAGKTNITVLIKIIMANTPDVYELIQEFTLKHAVVTRSTVSGELSYMDYMQDAFPKLRKTPSTFPGIF